MKLKKHNIPAVHAAATERAIGVISLKSKMSGQHKKAVSDIIMAMCHLASMESTPINRVAYPLSTGMGKTVSATSFIIELLNQGFTDTSILVATETLREVKEFHNAITSNTPEDLHGLMGVFYSPKKEYADIGIPDRSQGHQSDYPIVFMAHNGIESADGITTYNEFQGRDRDAVIWDEGLVKSAGFWLTGEKLSISAASATAVVSRSAVLSKDPKVIQLIKWASEISRLTDDALDSLSVESLDALPYVQFEGVIGGEVQEAFLDTIRGNFTGDIRRTLETLVKMSARSVRVKRGTDGMDVVLSYDTRIPDELRRVLVLDASCVVRAFYAQDASMTVVDEFARIKDFRKVKVKQCREFPCGKGRLNGTKSQTTKLRASVAKLLLSLPDEDNILICTSKAPDRISRAPGFIALLADDLCKLGFPGWLEQSRVKTIHWGAHKATNAYSDCKHIVAVGIQRQNPNELAAVSYGQSNGQDKDYTVDYISKTEQISALQQLVGRGTSRAVDEGVANESNVYLYDQSVFTNVVDPQGSVIDLMDLAMPNARFLGGTRDSNEDAMLRMVSEYIAEESLSEITLNQVWAATGITGKKPRVRFKALLCRLLGWEASGQRLKSRVM